MRHHVPPGEQVVELVGATDLDVGPDRDRVVGLHQRVEELGERDRLVRREPLREVVALEQLGDGERAGEPDDLGVRERPEPLAVVPDLGALPVEDAEGLLGELAGVRVEHLVREDGPLLRAP